MKLQEICQYLDDLLSVDKIQDYGLNGLQVECSTSIKKIGYAVDASIETFQKAAKANVDILIVHHGLFWGAAQAVTGYHAQRLQILFENKISLYAAHLPLDIHTELGNNAALVEGAGFTISGKYSYEKGIYIGMLAEHPAGIPYESIKQNLANLLGCEPVAIVNQEPTGKKIKKIAAVSGGGMKYAIQAAQEGAELFITGEPSHAWYHPIIETGIPCLLYGHYSSETVGLKRLHKHLAQEKGCEGIFIDHPTGM